MSRHTKGVVVVAEEFHNSIRLSSQERRQILQSMNQSAVGVNSSRRKHPRHEFELPDVPIIVTNPDGEVSRFRVCTRNISRGGIAFLHGGFLYPGCTCEFLLPTVWGGHESVSGRIVNCRHVKKHIHEFSIQFPELIDTRWFLTLPGETPLRSADESTVVNESEQLEGKALMIDPCGVNAALVRHLLKDTSVELVVTETVEEGIVTVRSDTIDALIVAFGSIDRDAEQSIKEFKESGFTGAIISATTDPDGDCAKEALEAGADEILPLPVTGPSLLRILSDCINGDRGDCGPIRSQLEHSPDTLSLVENYLEYVQNLVNELAGAAEAEDLGQLRKSCDGIASSAGGYGFQPLEEAAKELESALDSAPSIEGVRAELQRLQSVCARLAPMAAE